MKRFLLFLCGLSLALSLEAQTFLPEKWKFTTGDDPQWSAPQFDDSHWQEIDPVISWERQGFPGYDGYAWYRATFNLPASLQTVAHKYGGLVLRLGKVDDVDQAWFNGKTIGQTGSFPPDYLSAWNQQRQYTVPLDHILWDRPNSIAVRVYDGSGGGGLYGGPVELALLGFAEKVIITGRLPHADHILLAGDRKEITVAISNDLNFPFNGNLKVEVISDFGDTLSVSEHPIRIKQHQEAKIKISLKDLTPGFYQAKTTLFNREMSKSSRIFFGYEPTQIVSPPNPQPDFEHYWERARKELATVDPEYHLRKIDSLSNIRRTVYLLEMRSLGNVLIRAWYSVPTKSGVYPAVLSLQGYSTFMIPEIADFGDDIIGLALNIRGHGNSKTDIDPGFPGYLQHRLADKEQYIYRGAYMDCVRAIDFLFSRDEVDKKRVGVEGGSQGGALTFATAALDNDRIAVSVSQFPFLSDFEDYFKLAPWPANEFTEWVEKEHNRGWEEVFYTLSYIDIKNLAHKIKAPMLMGVGLEDNVCPPHINFAAYNQVSASKAYIAYPTSGHSLPESFHEKKMAFLRKHFGL